MGKERGRMGGERMAAVRCRRYQLDDNTMCKAVLVPTALVQSCAVVASRPGRVEGDG